MPLFSESEKTSHMHDIRTCQMAGVLAVGEPLPPLPEYIWTNSVLTFVMFIERPSSMYNLATRRHVRSLPHPCQGVIVLLLSLLVLFGSLDANPAMACASALVFDLAFNAYIGLAYDYFPDHGSLHRCRRIPTRREKQALSVSLVTFSR